jgi:serine/threonine-protein kinase
VLAISPDGTHFAYCTSGGIYVGSGNPIRTRLLPGTQGSPAQPFFSPNGKWIGYISERDGLLRKVSIESGNSFLLRSPGPVSGASWYADDSIIYSRNGRSIVQISANGKKQKVLFDVPTNLAIYPQLLPDGDSLLYTAVNPRSIADAKIMVRSLKSGQEKIVCAGGKAQYLSNGRLLYKPAEKSLLAAPFDIRKLEFTGAPVTVLKGIWDNGTMQYAASKAGTLVYIPEDPGKFVSGQSTLAWVTREGKSELLGIPPNRYSHIKISPDATHIALTIEDGEKRGLWIWDCIRKTMFRLTSDANTGYPLWTLDNRYVVYRYAPDQTNFDIVRKLSDGTGSFEKLASIPQKTNMLYIARTDNELLLAPIPGTDNRYPPQISPDGRWAAYVSDESGKKEVYVSPFPEVTQRKCVISVSGGTNPLWSPDGREIFYRYSESVISIPIQTSPALRTGNPTPLFWMPDKSVGSDAVSLPEWDISPDGKRFLMIQEVERYLCIVMLTIGDAY